MVERFGVTPNELRATSRDLREVSDRMKAGLRDGCAVEGPAWGSDRIGEQFAGGGGGYLAQCGWVDGSVGAKTGLLDSYSRTLQRAADAFEAHDGA